MCLYFWCRIGDLLVMWPADCSLVFSFNSRLWIFRPLRVKPVVILLLFWFFVVFFPLVSCKLMKIERLRVLGYWVFAIFVGSKMNLLWVLVMGSQCSRLWADLLLCHVALIFHDLWFYDLRVLGFSLGFFVDDWGALFLSRKIVMLHFFSSSIQHFIILTNEWVSNFAHGILSWVVIHKRRNRQYTSTYRDQGIIFVVDVINLGCSYKGVVLQDRF